MYVDLFVASMRCCMCERGRVCVLCVCGFVCLFMSECPFLFVCVKEECFLIEGKWFRENCSEESSARLLVCTFLNGSLRSKDIFGKWLT